MTEIIEQARQLASDMAKHFTGVDTGHCGECLMLAQSAITAARAEGFRTGQVAMLQRAASAAESCQQTNGDIPRTALLCADGIRALEIEVEEPAQAVAAPTAVRLSFNGCLICGLPSYGKPHCGHSACIRELATVYGLFRFSEDADAGSTSANVAQTQVETEE